MEELAPNAPLPDIDDIAAPLPPAGSEWLVYAIAAGMLAVVILILFLGRRKKRGPSGNDYDPFRSAMDQLHALKEEYTRVPANLFALRTSHALREYLFSAHDPQAPYQTSGELLRSLEEKRERPLSEESLAELRDLLADCDLMQYSCEDEATRLRLGVVESAIHFIREDRQRQASLPQPSPSEPSDADPAAA